MDRSNTIARICEALAIDDIVSASEIATKEYPFEPAIPARRAYTPYQLTRLFIRDGFLDRYSGARLLFPGTLRVLSKLLPVEFPAHKNWKMSETHIAYWELYPTVDHVLPISRGGKDSEKNWVTTSMIRNSAKSNWTLEELGWNLVPPGDRRTWNGMFLWFISYIEDNKSLLGDQFIRRWHGAADRSRSLID